MAQLLEETATHPIPLVRRVFFGGDLLRARDVDRMRRLMPQAGIANFYNSSETQRGGGYIVFPNQTLDQGKEIPPLGCGVKDVQLMVLNSVGNIAGVGELGEIWVRSPHLAVGYLKDEKLTKERFITNPFTGIDGDRIYRTGEQGRYLPNGDVDFVARRENQVSIRGFRVELGEIESVLKTHPAVSEAAVLARENPRDHLVAYVVANRQIPPSINELRNYVKAKLPNYMVPTAFVILDSLPLTPTGKVNRKALPALDLVRTDVGDEFISPRTPTEKKVATIWTDVLKIDRVGVHDNFFDLGGHSLLATQVISRMRDIFRTDVPLRVLFENGTVASLAAQIEQLKAKETVSKEKMIEVLAELESLSNKEAERLFARESSPKN
jgi:acyl carrier protein